jgi:hypothetical protein
VLLAVAFFLCRATAPIGPATTASGGPAARRCRPGPAWPGSRPDPR